MRVCRLATGSPGHGRRLFGALGRVVGTAAVRLGDRSIELTQVRRGLGEIGRQESESEQSCQNSGHVKPM